MSGPGQHDERRHENDPTGNGIVSHGPEKTPHTDRDRPHDASAEPEPGDNPEPAPTARLDDGADADAGVSTPAGAAPGASDDDIAGTLTDLFAGGRAAPASDELDEVALRRMLHGAVRDLAPSEATLDHLHRAVPARRAKRRQAVVGAAAAALLIGTAVPAFVHVATSDGSSTARPAIAGHGEQAHGGNGDETGPQEPGRRTVEPTERESEGGAGEADPDPSPSEGSGSDPDGAVPGAKPDSPSVDLAALPVCDPSQLGVASEGAGAPGADGTVYGSFKIANVSGTDCTVSSNGTVGFTALGAADPLRIGVVQHAAGDAAPGLPDPSQEPGTVLLKPSMAYEVRFAWVPTDTCPTVGPSPTPTPSAEAAGGSVGEGTGDSGVAAQSLREDGGGTVEGSVTVTHTPETGAPTAETKIPNACSGTIYRTGVLATS
ncbi:MULTISPECIES: hypothetical protein [unclassified Streptomyces]|uniref:hypothetical protein n=1 Tax=unclassified Streptomyces TaxID=2593676 RepID=UPI0037BCD443